MPRGHAFVLTDLRPAHLRGLPTSSWWLDPDFFARARQEQPRMLQSTLGKARQIVLAFDSERLIPVPDVSELNVRR